MLKNTNSINCFSNTTALLNIDTKQYNNAKRTSGKRFDCIASGRHDLIEVTLFWCCKTIQSIYLPRSVNKRNNSNNPLIYKGEHALLHRAGTRARLENTRVARLLTQNTHMDDMQRYVGVAWHTTNTLRNTLCTDEDLKRLKNSCRITTKIRVGEAEHPNDVQPKTAHIWILWQVINHSRRAPSF